MRQIISAVKYLHDKRIIHRHVVLENILVHYDSEEDRIKENLFKSKVKIIDFGFARYLKKGDLAKSTLGSPTNMDPGILRKLNKLENSKEYSYDEKVDIWGLGTICYEMLIGNWVFEAESMKELVSKVEKGNYFLPSTLSMEAVSFLNGMLKYDPTKRYTIEQLYRHQFLNKNIKDFHKINLNKIRENIVDSKIKMNTKLNETIWDIPLEGFCCRVFEGHENNVDKKEIIKKNEIKDKTDDDNNNDTKPEGTFENNGKNLSEEDLKLEFMKVYGIINKDFICNEPKLIPIIPGDDPSVKNSETKYIDYNF